MITIASDLDPSIAWSAASLVLLRASSAGTGPPAMPRRDPPREEQAAFVLADPALTIELVAAEPRGDQPGRDRLGRGRAGCTWPR